eukprot:gb/GEZN01008356.1/.p1 GENE.gb/GEZN01008356.1/~~gb/GEZN01008356.1/.p1  ORF type:complete len:226 (+),score=16.59 gb/GEZN01008356.1/:296-973(+)
MSASVNMAVGVASSKMTGTTIFSSSASFLSFCFLGVFLNQFLGDLKGETSGLRNHFFLVVGVAATTTTGSVGATGKSTGTSKVTAAARTRDSSGATMGSDSWLRVVTAVTASVTSGSDETKISLVSNDAASAVASGTSTSDSTTSTTLASAASVATGSREATAAVAETPFLGLLTLNHLFLGETTWATVASPSTAAFSPSTVIFSTSAVAGAFAGITTTSSLTTG